MAFSMSTSSSTVAIVGEVTTISTPTQANPDYNQVVFGYKVGSVNNTEAETIYTPTDGHTLYISSMTVSTNSAAAFLLIGDDLSASFSDTTVYEGAALFCLGPAGQPVTVNFPVPLAITTALKVTTDGSAIALAITVSGWQQPN